MNQINTINFAQITILILLNILCSSIAYPSTGKDLYIARCSMCHGLDARASGYLANKSNPPTPDLTTCAFQKKLAMYPGVIVSSIILQPNGTLIPDTLKKNGVIVPHHTWTDKELRSINQYIQELIKKHSKCINASI